VELIRSLAVMRAAVGVLLLSACIYYSVAANGESSAMWFVFFEDDSCSKCVCMWLICVKAFCLLQCKSRYPCL
jgi:hypothetical protein